MCEMSNFYVNGFQSWYFPDKPYCLATEQYAWSVKQNDRAIEKDTFTEWRVYMYWFQAVHLSMCPFKNFKLGF